MLGVAAHRCTRHEHRRCRSERRGRGQVPASRRRSARSSRRSRSAPSSPSNPPTPTVGDIYLGAEAQQHRQRHRASVRGAAPALLGRLPGSAEPRRCRVHRAPGFRATREVEKSFLSAKATIRQDGTFGIDNETTSVAAGDRRGSRTGVEHPVDHERRDPAAAFRSRCAASPRRCSAIADQGTAATGDDKPFVTLPTNCAAKTLSADAASYLDPASVTRSTAAAGHGLRQRAVLAGALGDASTRRAARPVPERPSGVHRPTSPRRPTRPRRRRASVTLPEGLGTNIDALGTRLHDRAAEQRSRLPGVVAGRHRRRRRPRCSPARSPVRCTSPRTTRRTTSAVCPS